MRTVVVIPARYNSRRLPGKPLLDLCGKPIIEWVWRQALGFADDVYIATDDAKIIKCANNFGGRCIATKREHLSGTSRVCEAIETIEDITDDTVVINLQADEPFVDKQHLQYLMDAIADGDADVATLLHIAKTPDDECLVNDTNSVKAVVDCKNFAMYFTRQAIPYERIVGEDGLHEKVSYYIHTGVYAFKARALRNIAAKTPCALSQAENLEQLDWLYRGIKIKCVIIDKPTIGIDTQADLERAILYIKNNNI